MLRNTDWSTFISNRYTHIVTIMALVSTPSCVRIKRLRRDLLVMRTGDTYFFTNDNDFNCCILLQCAILSVSIVYYLIFAIGQMN